MIFYDEKGLFIKEIWLCLVLVFVSLFVALDGLLFLFCNYLINVTFIFIQGHVIIFFAKILFVHQM